MRALPLAIVLALAGVAHAGPLAAVKKRGYTDAAVIAKGKVSVVTATGPDGDLHTLLVDGAGHVADGGDAHFRGKLTVTVKPFFGKKSLYDVDVAWAWSNGMGADEGDTHYIVRAKGFRFACSFDGHWDHGMEDQSSSSASTIAKTDDAPLTWTLTSISSESHHGGDPDLGDGDAGPEVTTYTLGAKGTCETSQ